MLDDKSKFSFILKQTFYILDLLVKDDKLNSFSCFDNNNLYVGWFSISIIVGVVHFSVYNPFLAVIYWYSECQRNAMPQEEHHIQGKAFWFYSLLLFIISKLH